MTYLMAALCSQLEHIHYNNLILNGIMEYRRNPFRKKANK